MPKLITLSLKIVDQCSKTARLLAVIQELEIELVRLDVTIVLRYLDDYW